VQIEAWTRRLARPALRRAAESAVLLIVILGGLVLAPLAIPVLPVASFIDYQSALGIIPASGERAATGVLPQHFADRFGWQGLADDVAEVVAGLSTNDRADCLVITSNYGEAGAIEYFWRRRAERVELPPVTSVHNSYHSWGPGSASGRVVIFVGAEPSRLEQWFASVSLARRHVADYAMPYESDLPLWICREPRRLLREVWPALAVRI
jgi:hypothetical protein